MKKCGSYIRHWTQLDLFNTVFLVVMNTCVSIFYWFGCGFHHVSSTDRINIAIDSVQYWQLMELLTGKIDHLSPDLVLLRPPLFPLFLTIYSQFGEAFFLGAHLMLNTLSVLLIYFSLNRLINSRTLALLGAVLWLMVPSFHVLAFFTLTETLSIFWICLAIYFVVLASLDQSEGYWFASAVAFGGLTLVKQAGLPLFVLAFSAFVICAVRKSFYFRAVAGVIVLLSLLSLQLAYTSRYAGVASLGTTGRLNFDVRFFPAVYGKVFLGKFIHDESPEAQAAIREYPTHQEKMTFVLRHPFSALRMYLDILWNENFRSGSSIAKTYEGVLSKVVFEFSKILNRFILLGFTLSMLVIAYRKRLDLPSAFLGVCGSILLAGAPMTYWQGDRIMLISLPFLLVVGIYNVSRFRPSTLTSTLSNSIN